MIFFLEFIYFQENVMIQILYCYRRFDFILTDKKLGKATKSRAKRNAQIFANQVAIMIIK